MTPNQKSFKDFIAGYINLCQAIGGVSVKDLDNWHRFDFETKIGKLSVTLIASEHEYKAQSKRGFVSIYLRFDRNAPALTGKCYGLLGGKDFNGHSGKWNIHFSGNKTMLNESRQAALNELKNRIEYCNGCHEQKPIDFEKQ